MATLTEQFQKSVVGSKGDVSDFVPTISSKGDFTRVVGLSAILASWNNILLTPVRTYNYNPEYGSELYKYVFEPADDITSENIRNEIISKLMTYDDRAKIVDIDIDFMPDQHGFIINISLLYKGEDGRLSLTIDGKRYLDFL